MPEPTERIQDSILHDVKQMVGQEWDDETYDLDIMTHINAVFFDLTQIGVGPDAGFMIMGPDVLWDAFLTTPKSLNAVKSYIFLRVRLLFDAPTNGFLVTSMERQITQMEWRLMVENDIPPLLVSPIVGGPVHVETLAEHLADETPHEAYDDLPNGLFVTHLQNGMA